MSGTINGCKKAPLLPTVRKPILGETLSGAPALGPAAHWTRTTPPVPGLIKSDFSFCSLAGSLAQSTSLITSIQLTLPEYVSGEEGESLNWATTDFVSSASS